LAALLQPHALLAVKSTMAAIFKQDNGAQAQTREVQLEAIIVKPITLQVQTVVK
jgi:hypothetical protein